MAEGTERRPDIAGMVQRGEIQGLIAALKGADPDTMTEILDALVGMGEAAVPALVQAVREEEHQVHLVASVALGEIGRPAVLPLVRAFREKDGLTRVKIADILADIGDPALDEILGALRDPDEEIRVLSAIALGEMRNPRAIDHLIVALRDGSETVRAQAAISLGELGSSGGEEALAKAAEADPSPAVRQVAVNALIRVRGIKEDREVSRGRSPDPDQSTPR
ncbi:MAG TPA: HEAT repeat domain-containing protein [Methanomicrobiales archaeon]|nr:HEAT repeat domain-containing protein [Methanomicrobiales archaeon]